MVVSALTASDGGADDNAGYAGHLVAPTLTARYGKGTDSDASDALITHTLTARGHDASEDGSGRGTPLVPYNVHSANSQAKERHAYEADVARCLDGHGGFADGQGGTVVAAGRRQEDPNAGVADTLRSHPRPGSASPGAIALVPDVASTLKGHVGKGGGGISPEDTFVPLAFHLTQDPISGPVSPALGAGTAGTAGVAFAENQRGELVESDVALSLSKPGGKPGGKPGQGYPAIRTTRGVRRLTPTECNRLMGWPDDWTYDSGPSRLDAVQGWPLANVSPVDAPPDGRRYSADGDGVAAHVAEWIGLGFQEVAS